eukprot:2552083-Amphidinium_carterae.1
MLKLAASSPSMNHIVSDPGRDVKSHPDIRHMSLFYFSATARVNCLAIGAKLQWMFPALYFVFRKQDSEWSYSYFAICEWTFVLSNVAGHHAEWVELKGLDAAVLISPLRDSSIEVAATKAFHCVQFLPPLPDFSKSGLCLVPLCRNRADVDACPRQIGAQRVHTETTLLTSTCSAQAHNNRTPEPLASQ